MANGLVSACLVFYYAENGTTHSTFLSVSFPQKMMVGSNCCLGDALAALLCSSTMKRQWHFWLCNSANLQESHTFLFFLPSWIFLSQNCLFCTASVIRSIFRRMFSQGFRRSYIPPPTVDSFYLKCWRLYVQRAQRERERVCWTTFSNISSSR